MANFLGVLVMVVVFIPCIIGLAAGMTWMVVRFFPVK